MSRPTPWRTGACLALAVLAGTATPVGASARPAKTPWAKQANAICRRTTKQLESLGERPPFLLMVVGMQLSAGQQATLREFLNETGTIKGDNAVRLRALAAPVKQRTRIKKLVGDLAAEGRSYRRAAAAVGTDEAGFLEELSEAGVRHTAAEKTADGLGAEDCAFLGGFGAPDSSFYFEASLGEPVFAYCIDTAEAGNEVSCDAPHDLEVYGAFEHPAEDDAPYPGEEAVRQYADTYCGQRFENFVGTDVESSTFNYGWAIPDADQWEQGDQTGSCALFRVDEGPLIGSASSPAIQVPDPSRAGQVLR